MSWIKKFWNSLTSLFIKIENAVEVLYKSLDDEAKILLPVAINIAQSVKKFMDSPADDFCLFIFEAATAGMINPLAIQKVHDTIEKLLPTIIADLTMAEAIVEMSNTNEQVKAILAKVKLSSKPAQDNFFRGLSNMLADDFVDGKLSSGELVDLVQYVFDNKIEITTACGIKLVK